jgi:hypothetical protein
MAQLLLFTSLTQFEKAIDSTEGQTAKGGTNMIFNIYLQIIEIIGWLGQNLTSVSDFGRSIWTMQMLRIRSVLTNLVKRLSKAILLPVRRLAYRYKFTKLYYWSESKLDSLRAVYVLPFWYYRRLYHACMWLVAIRPFQRVADRAIHTIPYQVRFEVA